MGAFGLNFARWASLGHPQEVLGRSLGVPGGSLGVPGASVMAPWGLLGRSWWVPGCPGGPRKAPRGPWGLAWLSPGRSWGALGGPKGTPGGAFERHRQPLKSLKNVGFCYIFSNWADQREHWWVPGCLCGDIGHLWPPLIAPGAPPGAAR